MTNEKYNPGLCGQSEGAGKAKEVASGCNSYLEGEYSKGNG